MSKDRSILEQTLGKMLGFDDGVADVLKHLLTIESRDVRGKNQSLGVDIIWWYSLSNSNSFRLFCCRISWSISCNCLEMAPPLRPWNLWTT